MPTNRTAYRYHFWRGGYMVRTGVTGNILYTEAKLQKEFGGGGIQQVGIRTTPDEAFAWEDEERENGNETVTEDSRKNRG